MYSKDTIEVVYHITSIRSCNEPYFQSTLSYLCSIMTDGACHVCVDAQREGHSFYGAAALIVRGHSQAKQRVILFLTIFIISGFCSVLPCDVYNKSM